MINSIISDLLNKAESRIEHCRPRTSKYDKTALDSGNVRKELLHQLTGEQLSLFERYDKLTYEMYSDEIEGAFRQGVSLGVRLTAEAFIMGEEE